MEKRPDTTKNGSDNDEVARGEATTPTETATKSFFSSRTPILGDKLGDVYEKAQRRAAQLREQAERIRQQQLEVQKQDEEAERHTVGVSMIPPATGMLVDGKEFVASDDNQVLPVNEAQDKHKSTINGTPATANNGRKKFPAVSPSSLRNAFNIVRQTSSEAATQLIFPIDAFAAGTSDAEDDEDDSRYLSSNESSSHSQEDDSSKSNTSSPEKDKEVITDSPSVVATAATSATLTPTRFEAATNSIFNAVGRYRRLKESASFDSSQLSSSRQPGQEQPKELIVGGADRVGGLRYFQLDGILDNSTSSNLLPPTMPFGTKPPGRDNLVKQTGGQWTMASNRGENAFVTTTISRSSSFDTRSVASETGSEDLGSSNRLPPSGASASPVRKAPSRTPSYYEEAVRCSLQPGQRALFFGKGTMGVVLKPTYLASWRGKDGGGLLSPTAAAKRGGIFIDSVIPGGHADKSGVVFVGDHVIKIGAVNVESMTLDEVVKVITETKRPNIMVLTSEHDVELVDKPPNDGSVANDKSDSVTPKKGFVSSLDLAFGLVNKLVTEGGGDVGSQEVNQDNESKQAIGRNSLLDNDEDDEGGTDSEEEVSFKSPSKGQDGDNYVSASEFNEADEKDIVIAGEKSVTTSEVNTDAENDRTLPGKEGEEHIPTRSNPIDIDLLSYYATRRTNAYDTKNSDIRHRQTSLLKRAALFDPNIRSSFHNAFRECVLDPRRYSFLEYFFRNYKPKKEFDALQAESEDMRNDVNSSSYQRRLLELYAELWKFHDAVMVCSESNREQLLAYARTISSRFLEDNDGQSSEHCLPEHIACAALGGTEKVHAMRFALNDEDSFFGGYNGDGFQDIRLCLGSFLSTQECFLSFLVSDDAARMRAYMRGCSPFLYVEPQVFLKPTCDNDASQHNFLLHAILHLVCMKENIEDDANETDEQFIKNDALLLNAGNRRSLGAASLLGCAFFIMRTLQKSLNIAVEGLVEDGMTGGSNIQVYTVLIEEVQFLWNVYLAPASGALSSLALSHDAQEALDDIRRFLVTSVDEVLAKEGTKADDSTISMAKALSSADMSNSMHSLAEALLRDYTLKIFSNFQRYIFYEWACKEAKASRFDAKDGSNNTTSDEYLVSSAYNGMSNGFLNRLLRQMDFPQGISLHRPSSMSTPKEEQSSSTLSVVTNSGCLHNGDVALVFGSDSTATEIRRFSCVSLQPETNCPRTNALLPEDIPPIFESYANVPPFHERPFKSMLQDVKNDRMSIDGWEVSLTNFVIPSQANGPDDEKWMYCTALVFRKSPTAAPQMNEQEVNNSRVRELQCDDSILNDRASSKDFQSPLSIIESTTEDGPSRLMKVDKDLRKFNSKLFERDWSQQVGQGGTIGLALISRRNVTAAMRETLSLLYEDYCSYSKEGRDNNKKVPQYLCQPLVDVLGVLSHPPQEIENESLNCILKPYLDYTTSKWVHRPLSDQSDIFAKASGVQLLEALPPVPLALTFTVLLLEQKVVFASSRRGMLMSASLAVTQLLSPLRWAHLHVPLVPVSMLDELVHYPAPFVLGIPTDEKQSASVLGGLPSDITLVDLDVGRVILASEFSNDTSKSVEGDEAVAGALRSQVLFLAESLGGAFGAATHRSSWCSDSPTLQAMEDQIKHNYYPGNYSEVIHICKEFIGELIQGIHSCCLWIEENGYSTTTTRKESAIIFDEDRFYHIKNMRAEGRCPPLIQKADGTSIVNFALSLDQFDLIFETFLRTQCLSSYISEGDKESMLFS